MQKTVFLLVLWLACAFGQPSQLNYKVGQQLAYQTNTQLVGSGIDVNTNQFSDGTTSQIQVKAAIQVLNKHENSKSYTLSLDLMHPIFTVSQPGSDGYTTYSDDSMGDTIYFEQAYDGAINKVVPSKKDNPTYTSIKLGIINALNTKFVPPSQSLTFQDNDPIGIHNSSVIGSMGSSQAPLTLTKSFSQVDFSSFSDPKLHPENVLLGVTNIVGIHASGYIYSSSFSQTSQLYNPVLDNSTTVDIEKKNNMSAADTNMIATSNVILSTSSQEDFDQYFAPYFRANQERLKREIPDMENDGVSMFELASFLVQQKVSSPKDLEYMKKDAEKYLMDFLSSCKTPEKDGDRKYHLIKFWSSRSEAEVREILLPRISLSLKRHSENIRIVGNAFSLVSALGLDVCQEFLVSQGLFSEFSQFRIASIFASAAVLHPNQELVASLWELTSDSDIQTRHLAVLHIGIVLDHLFASENENDIENFGRKYRDLIVEQIKTENDQSALVWWLYSVKNGGFQVFEEQLQEIEALCARIFTENSSKSVRRAVTAVAKALTPAPTLPTLSHSDYPYNRTYSTSFHTGGKAMGVSFIAELFAGTNFDCNQTVFNFEVETLANATSYFMGYQHDLFEILAIYGQDNGSPLADDLIATVWGYVIYSSTFPQLDCFHHTYPLSMATPSYSTSYTLWVAVIPVTFSFSVSLSFLTNLDWTICPNTLSAEIDITPYATFTLNGGIDVDFYIIKADVNLNGNLNGAVVPEAYIHGTECTVGFEVDRTNQPMVLELTTSYAYQTCVLFFFDCHWSDPVAHTWLHWSEPAADVVIYQDSWKIAIDQ